MRKYLSPSHPSYRWRRAFSGRILARMRDLDYSTRKLASLMGVSPAAASDWVNPKIMAEPELMRLVRLAQVLRCDLVWLLTGRAR